MPVVKTDLDLTSRDLAALTSADALTAFLSRLGYDTSRRTVLTPSSLGLSGDAATAVRSIELQSEDADGFLRVLFVQPRSLTAKVRNDLIRILGKSNEDYLVILAATFDIVEFVLLDKKTKVQAGPGGGYKVQVVPKTFSIDRRKPSPQDLRTLRQFTWTHQDALDQFDKLRVVFDNAIFTGEFFQNRGLFSDYFLRERLKEDPVWRENPTAAFQQIRTLYQDAQSRWHDKGRAEIVTQLIRPVFGYLGFLPLPQPAASSSDDFRPDFFLKDATGAYTLSAAFVYPWGRWLDGPDFQDPDRPDENPGARVIAAIEAGHAEWAIVVPTEDIALLGVLCSPLHWWHLTRVLPHMKDEALSPVAFIMESVPIAVGSPAKAAAIQKAVTPLLDLAVKNLEFESELRSTATDRFGALSADERVVTWLQLPPDTFLSRVIKLADVKQPTSKFVEEVITFHRKQRARQIELLARQLDLERSLATLVEDAYRLTPEERNLLRATRPIRDPLDMLEAKIQGRVDPKVAIEAGRG